MGTNDFLNIDCFFNSKELLKVDEKKVVKFVYNKELPHDIALMTFAMEFGTIGRTINSAAMHLTYINT
jgi:hypothetical protein